MATEVRRVRVWPGVVRLTHWAMAASLLVLIPTGWLLTTGLVAGDGFTSCCGTGCTSRQVTCSRSPSRCVWSI